MTDPFVGPVDYRELRAPSEDGPAHEIPMAEFTEREWAIFRQGQQWGWESRQPEVDTLNNAFIRADDDADRYYRAAYDHDNHDCAIHANKGRYQGAATRTLHWEYWGDDELDEQQ